MNETVQESGADDPAQIRVEQFRRSLGPFVVAADVSRMSMVFTDAVAGKHPVVFANDSFLRLVGLTREEVLGRQLLDLLETVTRADAVKAVRSALENDSDAELRTQYQAVDGRRHPVTLQLIPVHDNRDLIRQHFVTLDPREGEALWDKAPSHDFAPVFIASTEGPDHRFVYANPAYSRLVGRIDLAGQTVAEVLPEIREQGFIDLLDEAFRTGQPFVGTSMPISLETASGGSKLHYVSFVYQPMRDESGEVTGLFCEGYDVTAEKLATDQLSALQTEVVHLTRVNAMSMMATTIAHELNQPLAAICNYAAGGLRLLGEARQNSGALEEALREIDEAAQRAGQIISNVRTLMRRGQTPRLEFDLSVAASDCIRLLNAGAISSVVTENAVPAALTAFADRTQVQQVLINLLRNAREAAEGAVAGRVVVSAVHDAEALVISVADNGPGLPLGASQHLFEWTDSSKESGMGLGLSICRTIVEAHGGSIWLERSDRSGSEFRFTIPALRSNSRDASGG